jgi:polysaccharide transporter, PST family
VSQDGDQKGMRGKAVRGAGILMLAAMLAKVGNLVSMLVLARVLLQEEIGGFAMAFALVVILAKFANFESRRDIIRDPAKAASKAKAYLLVQGCLALVLALLIRFASGSLVVLWSEVALWDPASTLLVSNMLAALALIPLLEALTLPAIGLVESRMLFRSAAILEIVSIFVQAGLSIVLALEGFGVWALVIGVYAGLSLRLVLSWALTARSLLAAKLDKESLRSVFGFGTTMLLSMLIGTAAMNVPEVFVGGSLGLATAGIYKYAYMLPHAAEQVIEHLTRVSLSMLGRHPDTTQQARVYSISTRFSLSILMPGIILGLPHAEFLVTLILGASWLAAADPLRILIVLVVIRAGMVHWRDVATIHGRSDFFLKSCIATLGCMLLISLPLMHALGVVGMAWAALISWMLPLPFLLLWLRKVLDIPIGPILGPALAAGGLALSLGLLGTALFPGLAGPGLLTLMAAQLLIYALCLLKLDAELWGLARTDILRRSGPPVPVK